MCHTSHMSYIELTRSTPTSLSVLTKHQATGEVKHLGELGSEAPTK
jgi:hypothetical protein